jgi:D-alanyl-D-alanine carboxypeptidase (penicillin-binding protein 5/6)
LLAAGALSLVLLAPSAAAARAPAPQIGARSAVLVDARDGHVLYRREPRARRSIASTTKLMTALISLEHLGLRKRLRATAYRAAQAESRIDLSPGERISVGDLLRALLLESANDAAITLAQGNAGSVRLFVEQMNERARELGLTDTHYANPVGLDQAGNFSTALDLSRLARRLLRNETFAEIVDLPRARLGTGSRPRMVENRNDLVARVPWIDGVKTGHTSDAGYVLVGSGTRKGVRLVSVVLGSSSEAGRDADTLALLRYGFGFYRRVRPFRARAVLARARVRFYGGRSVALVPRGPARVTVRRGQRVRTRVEAPQELEGPIGRGVKVGTVSVFRAGKRVRELPLVTAEAVPEAGTVRKLGRYQAVFVILLVVAIVAIATRRRRRARKRGAPPRRVVT